MILNTFFENVDFSSLLLKYPALILALHFYWWTFWTSDLRKSNLWWAKEATEGSRAHSMFGCLLLHQMNFVIVSAVLLGESKYFLSSFWISVTLTADFCSWNIFISTSSKCYFSLSTNVTVGVSDVFPTSNRTDLWEIQQSVGLAVV